MAQSRKERLARYVDEALDATLASVSRHDFERNVGPGRALDEFSRLVAANTKAEIEVICTELNLAAKLDSMDELVAASSQAVVLDPLSASATASVEDILRSKRMASKLEEKTRLETELRAALAEQTELQARLADAQGTEREALQRLGPTREVLVEVAKITTDWRKSRVNDVTRDMRGSALMHDSR